MLSAGSVNRIELGFLPIATSCRSAMLCVTTMERSRKFLSWNNVMDTVSSPSQRVPGECAARTVEPV